MPATTIAIPCRQFSIDTDTYKIHSRLASLREMCVERLIYYVIARAGCRDSAQDVATILMLNITHHDVIRYRNIAKSSMLSPLEYAIDDATPSDASIASVPRPHRCRAHVTPVAYDVISSRHRFAFTALHHVVCHFAAGASVGLRQMKRR